MLSVRQAACRQEGDKHRLRHDVWVRSAAGMSRVIRAIVGAMKRAGYSERDVFGMHIAMEEALVNAVKHGHCGDWTDPIRVSYLVRPERVLALVQDRGNGFDPHQVPDPRVASNIERPCGRGLLLMRFYTTRLRYNGRGNGVTLCKCRNDYARVSAANRVDETGEGNSRASIV